MPEDPDLSVRRRELTNGFWIRRVASREAAVTRPQRLVRAEDNKENIPPAGFVGPSPRRRRRRTRKSPLPDWYPRTPLRDITAVVNAIERRSLRVQAARAAQANRNREASTENPVLVSPLPQEPSVSDQTPLPDSTPVCITACIASSSPVENPLQTPSTCSSFSEIDLSPSNKKQIATEEKLCRSIDLIEKIVKRNNLKKNVKEAATAKRVMQRRTLMSMR